MESIFFGDKKVFAIEIKEAKRPKKFYIRLWFNRLSKGDFKRSGLLNDTIADYNQIMLIKDSLYLSIFDSMNTDEIFNYTNNFNFRIDSDSERFKMTIHLRKYAFLASQFTNTQSSCIVLILNNKFRLIWMNDFGKPINDETVSLDYFVSIFEELKSYCNENGLV